MFRSMDRICGPPNHPNHEMSKSYEPAYDRYRVCVLPTYVGRIFGDIAPTSYEFP
jgi:hypothetical protein